MLVNVDRTMYITLFIYGFIDLVLINWLISYSYLLTDIFIYPFIYPNINFYIDYSLLPSAEEDMYLLAHIDFLVYHQTNRYDKLGGGGRHGRGTNAWDFGGNTETGTDL